MPTVILVDTSLEMATPHCQLDCEVDSDEEDNYPSHRNQTIVQMVSSMVQHIDSIMKIEFVSLVMFNSEIDAKINFTRDYSTIFDHLRKDIDFISVKDIAAALDFTVRDTESYWGVLIPYQFILLTNQLPENYQESYKLPNGNRLITILVDQHNPHISDLPGSVNFNIDLDQKNNKLTNFFCQLDKDTDFNIGSMDALAVNTINHFYCPYDAMLKCGHLKSAVQLFPSPKDYEKEGDFSVCREKFPEIISIFGFLKLSDISNPPFVSRHLILPKTQIVDPDKPCFTVLLHGALKIKSIAALVQLQNNWFALIFSWADNNKKSNLILSICEPGSYKLPWLGDLNKLSIQTDFAVSPYQSIDNKPMSPFPVKPTTRYSYSQNYVVWVKASGIQTDIQKILRNARKLPDKSVQFYKELNRLRRAILSYSFTGLFDMVITLLSRELHNLPSNNMEAARHLNYAIFQLKQPSVRNYEDNITPLNK